MVTFPTQRRQGQNLDSRIKELCTHLIEADHPEDVHWIATASNPLQEHLAEIAERARQLDERSKELQGKVVELEKQLKNLGAPDTRKQSIRNR
jgi:hypothetical protein